MKIGFDSNEACRLTGVTYSQLDYWDRSGFIRPSISKAKGQGTYRIYSFIDLLCLRTAKQLKNERIPLQRIRKSLEYLKRNFPDVSHPLAIWVFLTDGQTIFVLTSNKENQTFL
jgi:DNA-binding transcriptional MerR regulator